VREFDRGISLNTQSSTDGSIWHVEWPNRLI
jgi:hypothetical protein